MDTIKTVVMTLGLFCVGWLLVLVVREELAGQRYDRRRALFLRAGASEAQAHDMASQP